MTYLIVLLMSLGLFAGIGTIIGLGTLRQVARVPRAYRPWVAIMPLLLGMLSGACVLAFGRINMPDQFVCSISNEMDIVYTFRGLAAADVFAAIASAIIGRYMAKAFIDRQSDAGRPWWFQRS